MFELEYVEKDWWVEDTLTAIGYCNEILALFINQMDDEELLTRNFQQVATKHMTTETLEYLWYFFLWENNK